MYIFHFGDNSLGWASPLHLSSWISNDCVWLFRHTVDHRAKLPHIYLYLWCKCNAKFYDENIGMVANSNSYCKNSFDLCKKNIKSKIKYLFYFPHFSQRPMNEINTTLKTVHKVSKKRGTKCSLTETKFIILELMYAKRRVDCPFLEVYD